jgi:ABC-type lipoprotein export system ATPase subunit
MELEVKNLNKTYKTISGELQVLKNVSFSLEKGDWLTVIGPSGSGKSTLLHCLAGTISPDIGSVINYNQWEIHNPKTEEVQKFRRERLGFVYQDYKLFPQFNVLLNVMLPLIPYEKKEVLMKKAKQLLEKVNLSDRMKHMPGQLSGGEKQRVAIARALINNPDVLNCDEPTGNLDENSRDSIVELLKELNAEGTSIILVTHDRDIMEFGNKKLELHFGRSKFYRRLTGSMTPTSRLREFEEG